ncbi:MAG TPA: hypothetical protein ENI65_09525 [Gammaproteobacteria bacterium]|nr:hypothetical protein [Gammaproteobacteria bacterium]
MKKSALAISMALALASTAVYAGATKKDASQAIYEAVTANNQAAKMGFEWKFTYKKLLGPAKKAYHKGNYAKAIKKANIAKSHADLGIIQANYAKNKKIQLVN